MKTFFIAAVGGLILFTSCSTYRGAQTPDDMYYSASPKVATGRGTANNDYVQGNSSRNDGRYDQSSYNGYDDYATSDDRWLMMRVRDRSRWSVFDDYNYYNPYNDFAYGGMSGYGMGYGMGYGSGFGLGYGSGFYSPYYSFGLGLGYGGFGYGYFNNYYNWNSIYNPYYYNSIAVNPKLNPAGYTTVRNFNLGGYNNRNYNATNPSRGAVRPNYNGYVNPSTSPSRVYNNRQYYNGNSGGTNRRVYSNNSTINGGNNNQSYDRPVRAYTPSNNSSYTPAPRSSGYSGGSSGYSGGGGGGSSSGGGGSRPARR